MLGFSGIKMRRPTPTIALGAMVMLVIALASARLAVDGLAGSHDHRRADPSIPGTDLYTGSHLNPFWPQFGRLLLGRTWPGDYQCPSAPGEQVVEDIPPPDF